MGFKDAPESGEIVMAALLSARFLLSWNGKGKFKENWNGLTFVIYVFQSVKLWAMHLPYTSVTSLMLHFSDVWKYFAVDRPSGAHKENDLLETLESWSHFVAYWSWICLALIQPRGNHQSCWTSLNKKEAELIWQVEAILQIGVSARDEWVGSLVVAL